MGVYADPWSFRWCQALSQSHIAKSLCYYVVIYVLSVNVAANINLAPQDAVHITAILGESVVFNCHVEFPGDHPVPYVLQWEKKVSETGQEIPIYIWYENYPTHSAEGYEGRVSRVPHDSPFGAASLNLTNIRESDQGWYECKVVFLNRSPNQHKNGTWFHLDVHAPPRFSITPEDIIYVNLGDSIILNCQADGTPTPEILWYKDANPVEFSATVVIINDGTELRISTIRQEDIGDYTCIARNGEGQVSHTARVIIAGGAVIMVPPTNQTKLEGEKVHFACEAKAMPGNVTVRWFREGAFVREVSALETRVTIRKDGSLIINPVSADDSGQYTCEVSNGIGDPQSASAYLNVEYPAKVTFTPTVQYLPFRLAGVVQCYIKANPPLQYVTWTKDKRLLEPYQTKDIVIMNNGSLLFTRVNQNHQGRYTCTPYNAQGTQGSSGPMEVLVRKPPVFLVEPDALYQRKVGEMVEMHCDALEAEGTQKPNIQWIRRDGNLLQKNRINVTGGNITIENLRRADFGYYQCIASNEVATIIASTQLVIEGTQPHAPYNVSGTATEFSVTMSWMPGYSGGPDYKQDYTIWYRESGVSDWLTIPVTPSGNTQVTINRLSPGTTYEFQVVGKNDLGEGLLSKAVTIRTLDVSRTKTVQPVVTTPVNGPPLSFPTGPGVDIIYFNDILFPTGSKYIPSIFRSKGPKPGQPRNLTVTEIANGFLISWQTPAERSNLVVYYTIKYRTDAQWKTLNRGQIRSEETQYLVKNLVGGRTYYFRVLANTPTSYESSDEVKFPVPARVKHKAITAGVVGGILFFIVAIILSICAVKICNKRKRRKQEKEYNMVACRITDSINGRSDSISQVPLKTLNHTKTSINNLLDAIISWIWPQGRRCTSCMSICSSHLPQNVDKNLSQIHRTLDGRFVVNIDANKENFDEVNRRSICSHYTSSDDGGFIQKRRPIVECPSQLSFRSLESDHNYNSGRLLLARIGINNINDQNVLSFPTNLNERNEHFYLNALNTNSVGHTPHNYTQSTVGLSKFISSSPDINTHWSPNYFSDLSSVKQPSFEISTTPKRKNFLKNIDYKMDQAKFKLNGFVPVHSPNYLNTWRIHRQEKQFKDRKNHQPSNGAGIHLHHIETSPESRSSSSGFGSKNTSTQHNQSSQSGSTYELKYLPPYKPPPNPRRKYSQKNYFNYFNEDSPYTMRNCLDLIVKLNMASDTRHFAKSTDIGSVDTGFESPTKRIDHYELVSHAGSPSAISTPTESIHKATFIYPKKRVSRYDNIDLRVQAMKEEFNDYRKQQAIMRQNKLNPC